MYDYNSALNGRMASIDLMGITLYSYSIVSKSVVYRKYIVVCSEFRKEAPPLVTYISHAAFSVSDNYIGDDSDFFNGKGSTQRLPRANRKTSIYRDSHLCGVHMNCVFLLICHISNNLLAMGNGQNGTPLLSATRFLFSSWFLNIYSDRTI